MIHYEFGTDYFVRISQRNASFATRLLLKNEGIKNSTAISQWAISSHFNGIFSAGTRTRHTQFENCHLCSQALSFGHVFVPITTVTNALNHSKAKGKMT